VVAAKMLDVGRIVLNFYFFFLFCIIRLKDLVFCVGNDPPALMAKRGRNLFRLTPALTEIESEFKT
jgi:hypothetical protein